MVVKVVYFVFTGYLVFGFTIYFGPLANTYRRLIELFELFELFELCSLLFTVVHRCSPLFTVVHRVHCFDSLF
jgi:hypothetical protein